MRKLRPSTTLLRGLVAMASLLLSLTALPGAALCMGTNGHVAIEAVGSECVTLSDDAAPGSDAVALGGSALHGCTDTPLGAPGLRSSTDSSQGIHLTVARVPCGPAVECRALLSSVAERSALPAQFTARLSTILLL